MTDDEIRVKCAELQGAKWLRTTGPVSGYSTPYRYLSFDPVVFPELDWEYARGEEKLAQMQFSGWSIPNYPASVDAALTLCDRLRGEGWEPTLERPGLRDWIVTFEVPRGRSVESRDPSLARAICLAFLKVQDSVANSL